MRYKPGDRLRLMHRHPVEGWLGVENLKGEVCVIKKWNFNHRGEDYYNVLFEHRNFLTSMLHTMLEPITLTPFEQCVNDYIRSELAS